MLNVMCGAGALVAAALTLVLHHPGPAARLAALPLAGQFSGGGPLARAAAVWRGGAVRRRSAVAPGGFAQGADVEPRWSGRAVLALAGGIAVACYLVAGPVAALLAACLAGTAGRSVQHWHRRRRQAASRAAVLEAVGVLVAELRAGRHPVQALQTAAECSPALRVAATTGAWGGDVAEALRMSGGDSERRQPHRRTHPDDSALRAVAAGWLVAEQSGAGLADVLGSVEAELRSGAARLAETSAELAGSRATTWVLAGLPVLGVLLGSALGARPVHVLLHTPIGAACSVAGLLLEYAGVAWTGRLVAGASAVSRA